MEYQLTNKTRDKVTEKGRLLSLSKAARKLGVHPTTLRRWADQGDILVMTTPGGHRRFPLSEIERIKRTGRQRKGLATEIVDRVRADSRERLAAHAGESWLQKFEDTERVRLRSMGQEVLQLLKEYLDDNSSAGSDTSNLERIRKIGTDYGSLAAGVDLSLSELLEATSFFRDSTLESALISRETSVDSFMTTFRAINTFFNTLLVSASSAHQAGSR
ncbi:MAG: helix-turn-helix domain-containing protein [Rhodothermales bacterium]|nr:helix-turn-helix domain-containing protein [Rhodothermales bacterium]